MGSRKLKDSRRRFRKWRLENYLTLQQVADAVTSQLPEGESVSRASVSSYEAKRDPSFKFLWGLKKAFPDIDLHWLMYGVPQPPESKAEAAPEMGAERVPWWVGTRIEDRYRRINAATHIVDEFLRDLTVHHQEYGSQGTAIQPQLVDPSSPIGQLDHWFEEVFSAPFDLSAHFADPESLSRSEVTSYTYALLAAFRPLLHVTRRDTRSAIPIWAREQEDQESE